MSTINVRIAEGIAELELNRPDVRNAINLEMVREMGAALDSLLPRDEVRAVVLSGRNVGLPTLRRILSSPPQSE